MSCLSTVGYLGAVSAQQAAAPTDRKRQERGRRRIESILDAAELVIADVGYDAATMSLIATRAEISPGSLYQFFAGKEPLIQALAQRYVEHLEAIEWPADLARAKRSIADVVDLIVDPILAFHLAHPAANALLADGSSALAESTRSLHASLCSRVEVLLEGLSPGRSARERHLTATTSIQIFSAVLPSVLAARKQDRPRVVRELKHVLIGYWQRLGSDE